MRAARRRSLRVSVLALSLGVLPVGTVYADDAAPAPILPAALHWFSPPGNAAVRAAWVLGAEDRPGAYLLRVRLAADARLPPHAHPDARHTTVLSGTLYVGFGAAFDSARVVAVPVGAVYVAPAGVAHYLWARDGAVEYQEAGVGPTATHSHTH